MAYAPQPSRSGGKDTPGGTPSGTLTFPTTGLPPGSYEFPCFRQGGNPLVTSGPVTLTNPQAQS